MIADSLSHATLYSQLGPKFKQAFDYLRNTDLVNCPAGKYELDGEKVFVVVQEYTTKPAEQGTWEAHRRHIDVQYMIQGEEKIGYASLGRMQPGDYDETKDFLALSGEGEYVRLHAGDFAVFFPQDAHMPNLAFGQPDPVKKAVIKITVD